MSSKTLLTVLVFCSTICFIVGAPTCPSGWEYLAKTNACYIFKNELDNFDGAVGKCKAMNSTLVSIHSDEENKFVIENADKHRLNQFWIGVKVSEKSNPNAGYGSVSVGNYENVDGTRGNTVRTSYPGYFISPCNAHQHFICKKTF